MKKTHVNALLDKLIELDQQTSGAYYEMGQILSAIRRDKLYDVLGYESMAHLVEEELSFSLGTAGRYAATYDHFKRLGYTKNQALDIMYEYGFSNVSDYLPKAKNKVSKATVGRHIRKMLEENVQINFQYSAADYRVLEQALIQHGAVRSDTGRLLHSSEALLDIVRSSGKPRLKVVA